MNDIQRAAMLHVAAADNRAIEKLTEAHRALLGAIQAIPNSVHSVFNPRDVRAIDAAVRLIVPMLLSPHECEECGLPMPGPHRGTCSHSAMHGGDGGTAMRGDALDEIGRSKPDDAS